MTTELCIHGHFYQPPRQDPRLGRILVEAGAAPARNWNERITAESYAPMAFARRLDGSGRIADILNCYAWMSFNVGPTLMTWLRREHPELVARMREGDAQSLARWGHGNALAQIYHHVIMPLASKEDRLLETRWAVADFERDFGRKPEGMWLSECAVDVPTLETLAAEGLGFVILAPRQAEAVLEGKVWRPVDEGGLDIGSPYLVRLPSGASMNVVFYNGGISNDIAFKGLLGDGEKFWQHLVAAARGLEAGHNGTPLLSLATDGETYGHHFPFGEMALAYVLAQGYTGRDGLRLTNIAAHVAAHPPTREVRLREPSSWSCVHGVERWRSDCGCTDGGHPGRHQAWRGPLRKALEIVLEGARARYDELGASCFTDPAQALLRYGEVLADPAREQAFGAEFYKPGKADLCRNLLAMREYSLAAFASCAWFFDDISRIEPQNGMGFALAALDLLVKCGGPDLLPAMTAELAKAPSNLGISGAEVLRDEVLPRRLDEASLVLTALLRLMAEGRLPAPGDEARCRFELVETKISVTHAGEGSAVVRQGFEEWGRELSWRFACQEEGASGEARASGIPNASCTLWGTLEIMVRLPDGQEVRRGTADLSHPLREYLLDCFMAADDAARDAVMLQQARQALSLFPRSEETRHGLTRPEHWAVVAPWLPVAVAQMQDMPSETLDALAAFLAENLSPAGHRLAEHLVLQWLGGVLKGDAGGDAQTAEAVTRISRLLPKINWWKAQNQLWVRGCKAWPKVAERLGFI